LCHIFREVLRAKNAELLKPTSSPENLCSKPVQYGTHGTVEQIICSWIFILTSPNVTGLSGPVAATETRRAKRPDEEQNTIKSIEKIYKHFSWRDSFFMTFDDGARMRRYFLQDCSYL
jgi:hypothetical protein